MIAHFTIKSGHGGLRREGFPLQVGVASPSGKGALHWTLAHTLVVGNRLRTAHRDWMQILAIFKGPRTKLEHSSHSPAVSKSLRDPPKRCLHTPALGKSLSYGPLPCLVAPTL